MAELPVAGAGLTVPAVPGVCVGEDAAWLDVDDVDEAPDGVEAAELVDGAGATGLSTGDSVTGAVVGSMDAEADAGWPGAVDGGVGPVHSLFLIR